MPFSTFVRRARPFRNRTSLAVVLPSEWVRAFLQPGDEVELAYGRTVRIRPIKKSVASTAEGRNPGGPAAQPAQAPEENAENGGDSDRT
jgi:hypothetical protein